MKTVETDICGKTYGAGKGNGVDNLELVRVNEALRSHPIEQIGKTLRGAMGAMKSISVGVVT